MTSIPEKIAQQQEPIRFPVLKQYWLADSKKRIEADEKEISITEVAIAEDGEIEFEFTNGAGQKVYMYADPSYLAYCLGVDYKDFTDSEESKEV